MWIMPADGMIAAVAPESSARPAGSSQISLQGDVHGCKLHWQVAKTVVFGGNNGHEARAPNTTLMTHLNSSP